jgi:hypothetical protein
MIYVDSPLRRSTYYSPSGNPVGSRHAEPTRRDWTYDCEAMGIPWLYHGGFHGYTVSYTYLYTLTGDWYGR